MQNPCLITTIWFWDDEENLLSYENFKTKDNGEGKEFTPIFSVGQHQIIAKEGDVVNDDKGNFGSDPNLRTYIKSEIISLTF